MAEEAQAPELGDGPYRSTKQPLPRRRPWLVWIVAALVALIAVLAGLLWPDGADRPALSELPSSLFDDVSTWPAPEADLPPATPLAPLLVAASPDALAVLHPGEGAIRLRRGESITVRFNRPMIAGPLVGRELEASPLVFDPPIEGAARWTSRSTLSFSPAANAWTNAVRERGLTFANGLSSLSGEPLIDDLERVVVLDGAPRVLAHHSNGRISAGAALPLVFDARVNLPTLAREILAYEIGGGQRTLPITLVAARAHPDGAYRVDVRLARALEAGSHIGIALAPRYQPWGGESPAVVSYELAPRPFIEGIDCEDGAAYVGQCSHTESPGSVIDIGPSLRLLSSARLSGVDASSVRISPPLRELRVRLAPHGPPAQRLITIEGEWEADQVYEVRVGALLTEQNEAVRALPPLAVRSAGHPPQIRVAEGRLSFEQDAAPLLSFSAIHPSASDVVRRPVAPGEELRALVSPDTFVREGGASTPLAPLARDARPNRWGHGRLPWRSDGEPNMTVVAFRPDPSRAPRATHTAFVQSTDLGVTLRAHSGGILVWVTSLSSAQPIGGARVAVADAEARGRREAVTDRNGIARIALASSPLVTSHAVLVTHGNDRAALLLDPRRAITPASMALTPGAAAASDAPIATVFTDRGAYRPGESMHAKIVLRRVEGTRASAVREGRFVVRLFGPSGAAPVREQTIRPSRFGSATVDFDLAAFAQLGTWRIDVARHGRDESIGSTQAQVSEFRQPSFRVDLSPIAAPLYAGDRIGVDATATYLFGAPVTRGNVRWSLARSGPASYPERWSRYRFGSIGAHSGSGTIAAGDEALANSGALHIEAAVDLATSARSELALEAEVTDSAGQTQAARRTFTVYPAAFEVGVKDGDDWLALGRELDLEAVVIDHAGDPIAGRAIEAAIVREGWHSWWEWSPSSHGVREEGSYQMRRDQRREIVHRCRLTSTSDPVRCAFVPSRPGTYVLEASVEDEAGKTSHASRRIYVAGPDEQPDRDPPGAPIAVTPVRARWTVGERAELAFESPFESAEALITVEREGVLHVERRRVAAGGHVFRIPLTESMVPNVFVGVTLLAPRSGEPGEHVDLHAPDLRFGVAELAVHPATSALHVALEVPSTSRPGREINVNVRVTDARGRGARSEVALFAVDEGTLRLTGYQVPDPSALLFRPRPPAFAWEDLRRSLVSRVEPPPLPLVSGDGNDGDSARRVLEERERFDPTPLWAPLLTTDAEGRASARFTLPLRPTEYRVMAVAIDSGARSGRASTQLRAEQPLTIRAAFPRFATAGDRFEAVVFVHNTTDAAIDARVLPIVAGTRREARTVTIAPRGEARVAERVMAPRQGPLTLRFEAQGGGETTSAEGEVPVVPRARFVRSRVFVAARGNRELTVGLPAGTPRAGGMASLTVASHPFVGLEHALSAIETSWSGTEPLAAQLLGLCAYADLELEHPSRDEIAARGRRSAAELHALVNAEGGFGRWTSGDATYPYETAIAAHALDCAADKRWIEAASLERARETLIGLANGPAFSDTFGEQGPDQNAYALRVLAELHAPQEARAGALYEQRERLTPYGMAQLAMALGADDPRAESLVTNAARIVLATREDEATDPARIRFVDSSARVHGALLEAASRTAVGHRHMGALAGKLLTVDTSSDPVEAARALSALAAYARHWEWDEGERPLVSLDGHPLRAASRTRAGGTYTLPIQRITGSHRLRMVADDETPFFFAIDGRYALSLGEADTIARGRRVAIHRVYETPDGRPLESGSRVALGEMVRVRLWVYIEEDSPELVALRDPLPAGFEAVDAAHETTPRESLMALMGMGSDDDTVDARAQHAMRSLSSIAARTFATEATSFYFDRLPYGLSEYTYAIRATTVGQFTAPPSQIEALHDRSFLGRSAMGTLSVVESE